MSETPQEWFSRKVEEYKDDPEYLRELVKIEHGEVLARDARIAELEAALERALPCVRALADTQQAMHHDYVCTEVVEQMLAALKGDADESEG